jgi:glycosyltransferase involved in cell wall biosynthesis
MNKSLSVVFPAFNEQANIGTTIETARQVLPRVAQAWEIIVVNDGSRDGTADVCNALAGKYPEVRAIHHPQNLGYGAALKSGVLASKYELIFFSDSDGQFDLTEISDLIHWTDEFDIVAGFRAQRRDPFYRRLNAWGWNVLVRILLGLRVRDIDCAFKVFRRAVFERIQIRSVGAMVNTEILAQAIRLGMSIKEVKVSHYSRRHGIQTGANIRVVLKAFRELVRLWRMLRWTPAHQEGLFVQKRAVPKTTESKAASKTVGGRI